jgi:predicted HicB family RNase H-like nuclease
MMEYKGYIGVVEVDEEAGVLHGEVINIRDVVTFEGQTLEELQQAFRDSVEDYLEFCAIRGEDPEKPFSGKFVVRLPVELHRKVYIKAKLADKSLNSWVTDVLTTAVQE